MGDTDNDIHNISDNTDAIINKLNGQNNDDQNNQGGLLDYYPQ